jgi:hypothetical protein
MAESAEDRRKRIARMNAAIERQRRKNGSRASIDKRAKKAAWWKRQAEGGD